jgi:hypothetical protein
MVYARSDSSRSRAAQVSNNKFRLQKETTVAVEL